MNLQLAKFSFPIAIILFTIGFLSLFMIARNEKVGLGLLKFIRIGGGPRSSELLQHVNTYKNSTLPEKIQHTHLISTDIYQDPIVLLQDFVDELSRKHKENMDFTTLDSFCRLNDRLSQLIERSI